MTHFQRLGQKSKNIFFRFLVQMRTTKFGFEINWLLRAQCGLNYLILDLHESGLSLNSHILINYHLKCFYYFNFFLQDVFYLSCSLHFVVDAKILFYLSIRMNSFSKWLFNREKNKFYKENSNLGIWFDCWRCNAWKMNLKLA